MGSVMWLIFISLCYLARIDNVSRCLIADQDVIPFCNVVDRGVETYQLCR